MVVEALIYSITCSTNGVGLVSKRQKKIQKIVANPKNVSFEDLDRVFRDYGYERRNHGSSHYVYCKPGCDSITIPKKHPINSFYVKRASALLGLEDWLDENS